MLTQVIKLATITACIVAVALCEIWVFKYGITVSLVSENGPQFVSKLSQSVCRKLGITNFYTSTYHPQTNGQVRGDNHTLAAMLENYVNDNRDDWDKYS